MAVLLNDGRPNLKAALHAILGDAAAALDPARGIFLKPNIVFPLTPASGEITPTVLVAALVAVLRERYPGVDIVIGEGVAAGCDPQENFRASGYAALAADLGVPLIDLDAAPRVRVPWQFGALDLPVPALERTYINLPVLKPSSATVISAALKNQKGLVTPAAKKQFHRHGLHAQLAALNLAVRPSLTIMDASRFFKGRALMAGDNCGEIDATACRLLGIDEPEHVQLARAAGVFADGFDIRAATGAVGGLARRRGAARPVAREFKRLGRLRLWSNPQACTLCRQLLHDVARETVQDAARGRNLPAAARLARHAVEGAEIIMGLHPRWRHEYGTVICIGDCTRRVAVEGNAAAGGASGDDGAEYIHIPGCPPTVQDFYRHLAPDAGE